MHFVSRNSEVEVVKQEKLDLKLVQLGLRKSSHLGIARVGIKNVTEKFAGNSDACDDEAMYVVTVNYKVLADGLRGELGHAVEIDKEGEKNLI